MSGTTDTGTSARDGSGPAGGATGGASTGRRLGIGFAAGHGFCLSRGAFLPATRGFGAIFMAAHVRSASSTHRTGRGHIPRQPETGRAAVRIPDI